MFLFLLLSLCWASVSSQVLILQKDGYHGPCVPNPCGANTECRVRGDAAYCLCLPGYLPDPDTTSGCRRRRGNCERDSHCGENAYCSAAANYECKCLEGYRGNPLYKCTYASRGNSLTRARLLFTGSDNPCSPSPCGADAHCKVRGGRPVCTCPPGFQGNPLVSCRRGECLANEDCPDHRSCVRNHCVNPCQSACGIGAQCQAKNHVHTCSCPPGMTGNPSFRCVEEYRDPCEQNPCGVNTVCRSDGDKAQCQCADNYIGDPLEGCRHECEEDHHCNQDQTCVNFKCIYPCDNLCGENAKCSVRNHQASCSCPEDYLGDPFVRCFPECVEHSDCPSYQACFSLKCKDPCDGACGINANCEVKNHRAICSCPEDYVGHPYERCRPFNPEELCQPNPCGTNADCKPGKDRDGNDRPVCTCPRGYQGNALVHCRRGECITNSDCPDHRACYDYHCENPCNNRLCGVNAECVARNHGGVCTCRNGYEGDALIQCSLRRGRYLG